jgi:hypothetical protein
MAFDIVSVLTNVNIIAMTDETGFSCPVKLHVLMMPTSTDIAAPSAVLTTTEQSRDVIRPTTVGITVPATRVTI